MASKTDFTDGAVYNFVTTSAVLGTFKNVTAEGVVNYRVASKYIDAAALHANVFSTLPPGTPNDFTQYQYLIIRHPNGNESAVGLPWIQDGTVELIQRTDCYIKLVDVSSEKEALIRQLIADNGFRLGSITFK